MDEAPAQFDMSKVHAIPVEEDNAPEKFDMNATQSIPIGVYEVTQNPNNQGTYEMSDPKGKLYQIPYSNIGPASKMKFVMTSKDRDRYLKDAKYDPALKDPATGQPITLAPGVAVTGMNSAGQPMISPTEAVTGNPVARFASSLRDTLKQGVKGVGALFDPHANDYEREHGLTTPFDAALSPIERLVEPQVQQGEQAIQQAKAGDTAGAVGHGLAAVTPGMGPWAAQAGEQIGTQYGKGDIAGAAGSAAGNAALYYAPEAALKTGVGIAKKVAGAPRAALEAITDTGPHQLKTVAEDTEKENAATIDAAENPKTGTNALAAEKHQGETQDALQKTQEAEDLKAQAERLANEKLQEETDKANEKERQRVGSENLAQITKERQDRLDALKENKGNIADYDEQVAKVKAENDLKYHQELQRQAAVAEKSVADKTLGQKVKAAYDSARSEYNGAWNAWRDKIAGVKVKMQPIVDAIDELRKSMNPESFGRSKEILKETSPEKGDVDAAKMARAAVIRDNGYLNANGDPINYERLAPHEKADIDREMARQNLQSVIDGGVQDVPAERLHTWKSQLEQAVRTTTDGTLRHAIGKVLDSVRELEVSASQQVPGADDLLLKARALTGPFFDAFTKGPKEMPKEMGKFLRDQTPDQVRADEERARLERMAAYDPSIRDVSARIDGINKRISELGERTRPKDYTPLPPNPVPVVGGNAAVPGQVPTLQERLAGSPKPETKPLQQFTPTEAPKIQLPPANRTAPPYRPPQKVPWDQWEDFKRSYKAKTGEDVPPHVAQMIEQHVVSPEELKQIRADNVKKSAAGLAGHGVRRAINSVFYTIPLAVTSVFLGHPALAMAEFTSSPGILFSSHKLATLLEKPGVSDWLAKITKKDIDQYNNLPPGQQAGFSEAMAELARAATEKKLALSGPLKEWLGKKGVNGFKMLGAATAGAAAKRQNEGSSPDLLKPKVPTPLPPPLIPTGATHYYDDETGQIVPVQ